MTISESTSPENKTSIIFVGSPGPFSLSSFKALISKGIPISHVICAGVKPAKPAEEALPVTHPDQDVSLITLARRYHIPLDFVSRPSDLPVIKRKLPETPDYILVACFPFRIPESIIQRARIACLNIHPSLLPKYRGPDPIFWQLKHGETQTGVSLHQLTRNFDAGTVVMQKSIPFKEGAYKKDIELQVGQAGADLFITLMTNGKPLNENAHAQDETNSSYYPSPISSDYQATPDWSAQRAFNFFRGTWPPVEHHIINTGDTKWIITQALEFSSDGVLPELVQKNNDELYIQFSPGILHVRGYKA